ncbi:ribosome assembly protein METTL17, mitochondrial [Oratosquilla oratoria]|uniref:ribosome assembly protein METTL17, mitochondrial n=1 Tax=Oratosquilla oratoria TaxID=337810 RepID=UPI003F764B93
MLTRRLIQNFSRSIIRYNSTEVKPKFAFSLDDELESKLKSGTLKYRKHPGVCHVKKVVLPTKLKRASLGALEEYPVKTIGEEAKSYAQYLWSRHPPLEQAELQEKLRVLEEDISSKELVDPFHPLVPPKEQKRLLDIRKGKLVRQLKKEVYNWKPIHYNAYQSKIHMAARLAPEYAALMRVFHEIKRRDPSFSPVTFLDFGSGIGSGIWAVDSTWENTCKEVVMVDPSVDMNNLNNYLLEATDEKQEVRKGATFYKQFLPASDSIKYDMVLSSRTLFELPGVKERLQSIDILWRKTKNFLVIVEAGTSAGYKLVLEARDYVMELAKQAEEGQEPYLLGHVYAPCPHSQFCPRFFDGSNTPCNFEVNYEPLLKKGKEETCTECFSYVILKKGPQCQERVWPRVVRPVLQRSRHVIARTCTPEGILQEYVCTKTRHGKHSYKICKWTNWGDLLPITASNTPSEIPVDSQKSQEEALSNEGEEKILLTMGEKDL